MNLSARNMCVYRVAFVCVRVCVCVCAYKGDHVGQGVDVSDNVKSLPVCGWVHADHSPLIFNLAVFRATNLSQFMANSC